jgi:hypothetical protein
MTVYVLAIRKNQSGGSESLHQLASTILAYGVDVKMYYPDSEQLEIPEKFKVYGVEVAREIVDKPENVIIVPETETQFLYKYKNIRKCIWWLSRDFYYGYSTREGLMRSAERHNVNPKLYFLYIPLVYFKKKLTFGYFRFGNDKNKVFHMYNCEYARTFLSQKGISKDNMLYMCGPLRNEYFHDPKYKKENIVTYNPKKNYRFTMLLINALKQVNPDLKVIPIEGMIPAEIAELLGKAKVYIDFGQFPGPERIPREAAMMYCNIITSKFGSTMNKIDVPIPEKFKFAATEENINIIIENIVELCENHEKYVELYDIYREKVRNQRESMQLNTKKILENYSLV